MTQSAGQVLPGLVGRRLPGLALAALAGAGTAFGLAPYGIWPLALLGWATLPLLMLSAPTAGRAAALGWAFSAGYFAHALSWIVDPFLVDPVRHGWMAPFALVLLAGGLAIFWAAAFWGAHRLGRTGPGRVLLLCPLLGVAEFARAYIFTGFPWAAPAQVFVDSPALALLRWVGPHGLGLLGLGAGLGLGLWPWLKGARRVWALIPAGGLAALTLAAVLTQKPSSMTGYTVRLIQPNAAQHEKWDPARIPVFFDRQIALTAAGDPPDLVIWPESAIAPTHEQAGLYYDRIAMAARGAQVALGIRRFDQGRFYNALVRLDPAGGPAGIYDKHHLVPFGEYIPLGGLAKRVGLRGLAAEDGNGYSAGPGPRLLDFGPLGTALPLICYEAVFPQDVTAAPSRPDFLLQVTNDAWFGSFSGPYQHLTQARMRAAEQGLPLLRAANTGISAVIDGNGVILQALPLGQAGFVDHALPAPLPVTLYARTGDKSAAIAVLLLLAGAVVAGRRRVGPISD
ncbi:MAG: apolipoprotein N-acyltransferase [Marinibacterium sp.]